MSNYNEAKGKLLLKADSEVYMFFKNLTPFQTDLLLVEIKQYLRNTVEAKVYIFKSSNNETS